MISIVLLALCLRVPFVSGMPDTPDGVRLIRSLDVYDLHDYSPHFPGYPVAVALARVVPLSGGLAWAILSALAGATACVLLAGCVPTEHGARARAAAALACAVLPFMVSESLRVATDMLFLPFLAGGLLLLCRRRRPLLAGVLLGIGLGVRPSAWPWALAVLAGPGRRNATSGVLLGVALWLVPTLMLVGDSPYLDEGVRFVKGHFLGWGGTVLSTAAPGRTLAMLEHWFLEPFRLPVLPTVGAALMLLALAVGAVTLVRRSSEPRRFLPVLLGGGAYTLWLLMAQNPEHARHALPLAALLVAAGAAGLTLLLSTLGRASLRHGATSLAVALVLTLTMAAVQSGLAQRTHCPAALAAVRALAVHPDFDPLLDRVYTGGERAYFRWIEPDWDVVSVASLAEARQDVRGLPLAPRRAWITTSLLCDDTGPLQVVALPVGAGPGATEMHR